MKGVFGNYQFARVLDATGASDFRVTCEIFCAALNAVQYDQCGVWTVFCDEFERLNEI